MPASAAPELSGTARLRGILLLALAYAAVGAVLLRSAEGAALHELYWPSAGLAVGALVRFGVGLWPGVVIGALLSHLPVELPPPLLTLHLVGATLGPVTTAALLRRQGLAADGFPQRRQVLAFVLATALGMLLSVAILTGAGQLLGGAGSPAARWDMGEGWLALVAGVILVAPVIFLARPIPRPRPARVVEYLALTAGNALLAGMVFSSVTRHPVAFATLLPIVLASLRFPGLGAAVQALVLAAVATPLTLAGRGPFAAEAGQSELVLLSWFLGTGALVHLVHGAVLATLHREEAAARANAERLRLAVEAGRLGTWSWDLATDRVTWNAVHAALWGYGPGEFDGSYAGFARRLHPEDRERVDAAIRRSVDEGAPLELDFRIVRPDASVRVMRCRGERIAGPEGGAVHVGVVQEITEAVERTTQLRLSEARLQSVVNSSLDAIVMLGADQRILVFNPAAERMFGCRAEEVLGQPVDRFVPATFRAGHGDQIARFGGDRENPSRMGTRRLVHALRADGTEFPIEASISRMEVEGRPAYAVAVRDLTGEHAREAERERLELQLRQAMKMEAIGTLAGGIAHDFNNILGAIVGNAELAEADLPADHPARASVAQIRRASLRARDLVASILAFSRQRETRREVLDLARIVEEALVLLRASLPATIAIRTEVSPVALPVFADPTQMLQLLMNLGTNAFHAMHATGGELVVALEPGPKAAHGQEQVRLVVRDSGAGMPPEVRERIFEPFFTTKAPGEGTGLGLAVVHGIVEAHGGTIVVESVPGQGTRFEILLPAAAPDAAAAGPAPSAASGSGERVMFVDDEPALVLLARRQLERLGYGVRAYSSPSEALAAFATDPEAVDVLITDLTMPGMLGTDLARAMHKLRPGLPVILTSGYSGTLTPAEATMAGIRVVLPKPTTRDQLARALTAALAGTAAAGARETTSPT